jgi:hypothetical protein
VRLVADMLWVLDLQAGEGGASKPGGRGSVDLSESGKQQIWVCPMFEPFLEWFYRRDLNDSDKLPALVNLGDGPTAL